MLFRDNIAYGFRRNALGIRLIAIVIAIGCLFWALAKEHVLPGTAGRIINWAALTQLPTPAIASLAVSGAMLLVWVFFYEDQSAHERVYLCSVATAHLRYVVGILLKLCEAVLKAWNDSSFAEIFINADRIRPRWHIV